MRREKTNETSPVEGAEGMDDVVGRGVDSVHEEKVRGKSVFRDDEAPHGLFRSGKYGSLQRSLIPFSGYVKEKASGFIGRKFIFRAFDAFMDKTASGYFIIRGDPGIGKTSLIAHMVKTRGHVHHFNISTRGINRPDQFLGNVCARLMEFYNMDRPARIPPEALRDGAFLNQLLEELSRDHAGKERVVVLVDALDEVNWSRGPRENVLFLPPTLPEGVFFLVTTRNVDDLPLFVESYDSWFIDPKSSENEGDARAYITRFANRAAMRRKLREWGADLDFFTNLLLSRSEGNFIYLRHVLPALEKGRLNRRSLKALPRGLKGYYDQHWRQMRDASEEKWIRYRKPVICFLSAARQPASIGDIAAWGKLEPARVEAVIRDWLEFLHVEDDEPPPRYRIYHASFQEFLSKKNRAGEIDLSEAHRDIALTLVAEIEERPVIFPGKSLDHTFENAPTKNPETNLRFPEKVTILFLAANPTETDWVRLDEESRLIDEALRKGNFRDRFQLEKHFAVKIFDIQELFLRYKPDIVHFCGHGSGSSEIVVENERGEKHPIPSKALKGLFSIFKERVQCVVLNTCYSEDQARTISEYVGCVIGMAGDIFDKSAISFARAFYRALGYGTSIRKAFELGCNQMELDKPKPAGRPRLLTKNDEELTIWRQACGNHEKS